MSASLAGPAARVLWELHKDATTADLVHLLQSRFGTEQHTTSYRAKLRVRHREENEPLQDLYRDISHLLQLAYPGEGGRFISRMGVDTFITALNDRELEYEVLKLEHKTLEEAANHAMRLDALAHSVDARTPVATSRAGGQGQSRQRNVYAVTDNKPETGSNADLLQRIAQLEEQLKQATGSSKGAEGSSSSKTNSKRNNGHRSSGRNGSASADGDAVRPNLQTHPCTFCKELGHWRRDCPKCKEEGKESARVQPVLSVSTNMSPTKIYVTAEVNGEPVRCLLDSGCERSVISAGLAPESKLTPSQYTLFAANKASLDVLGDTIIPFVIDGHAFEADVSVCDKVEDFLLVSDWLEQQGAQWDFANGTVTLGDTCIKVHRRHRTGICRRVMVANDCVILAKHEANIPVYLEDDGVPIPPCDWAIEPQGLGLGPGVMTMRTLFSNT